MTTPVMPALPAVRPTPAAGSGPGSDGDAFASALDGALSTTRDPGRPVPDRGDGSPDDRADDRPVHRADHARSEPHGHAVGRRARAAAAAEAAQDDADPADAGTADGVSAEDAPTAPTAPAPATVLPWAALAQAGVAVTPPAPGDPTATPAPVGTDPVGAATGPLPAPGALPAPGDPPPAGPAARQAALQQPGAPAPGTPTPPSAAPAPTPASPATPAGPGTGTTALDGVQVLVATAAPAPDAALPPAGDAGPVGSALASPGAGSTAAADAPADSAATGTTSDAAAPAAPAPDPGAAVPAVVVGPPAGSSTAPVPAAAPATPAQPVGSQLAQPVAVLASRPDGVHTVTVVLHPDDLGPVQVQVTVRGGSVDLHLAGAHEHGRAALLEALPDLRRDLQGAGISCSRMDVSRDTGGSWTSHQQSAGQSWQQGSQQRGPAPGEGRPGGPWLRTPDRGRSRPAPPSSSSASQGVDLLV